MSEMISGIIGIVVGFILGAGVIDQGWMTACNNGVEVVKWGSVYNCIKVREAK